MKGCVYKASRTGTTPLHLAVRNNRMAIAEFIAQNCLRKGMASINERKTNGLNSASVAAHKGHLDMLKFLEQNGVDLEVEGQQAINLTYLAAQKGHVNVLEYLKEKKLLKLESRAEHAYPTPLLISVKNGNLEATKWIIEESKIEPNEPTTGKGENCLLVAAKAGNSRICKYFLEELKFDIE